MEKAPSAERQPADKEERVRSGEQRPKPKRTQRIAGGQGPNG